MARPSPCPAERRERAVRMVAGARPDCATGWAALKAVAAKLGTGAAETVRTWVRRAQADTGRRPRVTVEEAAEIKRLTAETAELRRTDEILNRRLRTAVGDIPPHEHETNQGVWWKCWSQRLVEDGDQHGRPRGDR